MPSVGKSCFAMGKSKTIKVFALIGIALFVIFVVVPPFTRKWAWNHFIRYSSVIPVSNWKEFSSANGGFSILFPGKPELTNVTVNVSSDDLLMPCYFVWNRQMEFAVNFSDNPKNLKQFPPEKEFDICQSAVAKSFGKIVYQRDLLVDGYPAREFEYEVVGKVNYSGRLRLVLVKDRLYQLMFIFKTGYPRPPDRDTFFNSFRVRG